MPRTRPLPTIDPCSPSRLLVRLRQAGSGNVRTLRAEELAGDVEGLAANNNNLLAVEELLGDDAGEATEEVALAVNDDLASSMLATRVSQLADPLRTDPKSIVRAGVFEVVVVRRWSWADSRDRGGGMHWNHQERDNTYHLLESRHLSRCLLGRKGNGKEILDRSVKLRLMEWQRGLAASLPSRWLMVFNCFFVWSKIDLVP
jgi:hypothetical protein